MLPLDSRKEDLFALLPQIASLLQTGVAPRLHNTLITFAVLLIPIGRIQDHLASTTKFLDVLSQVPEAGAALPSFKVFDAILLALGHAQIAWSSFHQFALPSFVRHTNALWHRHGKDAGSQGLGRIFFLLSELKTQGHLDDIFAPGKALSPYFAQFRSATAAAVSEALSSATSRLTQAGKEADAASVLGGEEELEAVRSCCSFAPLAVKHDANCILAILHVVACYSESSNDLDCIAPYLGNLAESIESLPLDDSSRDLLQSPEKFPVIDSLLSHCVDMMLSASSSRHTLLLSVQSLITALASHTIHLPDAVREKLSYAALRGDVMSQDSRARKASLELLALAKPSDDDNVHAAVEELVEIESTPLTVETIRARIVKTRAIARSMSKASSSTPSSDAQKQSTKIVVDYIISSLKLNFKPIWSESIDALKDLAARDGDIVWESVFQQLMLENDPLSRSGASSAGNKPSSQHQSLVPFTTSDSSMRNWTDPQLLARQQVSGMAISGVRTSSLGSEDDELAPLHRLDVVNYRTQILKLLAGLPSIVHRHNAEFVAHFLLIKDTLVESQIVEVLPTVTTGSGTALNAKERLDALSAYLRVFASLSNPKSLSQSETLRKLFLALCAAKDKNLQSLALQCMLTWKDPAHVRYQESLNNLLEPSKQRDELVGFNLGVDAGIQGEHRTRLLPLVIHLLFGQMTSSRGRSTTGAGLHSRRTAMLSALALCQQEELATLCDLMLSCFKDEQDAVKDGAYSVRPDTPSATHKQQKGFLSFLSDVLRQLGAVLVPHWNRLLSVVMFITVHANRNAVHADGGEASHLRSLRQEGLKRLNQFFAIPQMTFDWEPFRKPLFEELVSPRLASMHSDSVESPTALQELFLTWSSKLHLLQWLEVDRSLLPCLFECLSAPSIKDPVVDLILSVMENLLRFSAVSDLDDGEDSLKRKAQELKELSAPHFLRHVSVWCGRANETDARGQLFKRTISALMTLSAEPSISNSDASILFTILVDLMAKGSAGSNESLRAQIFHICRVLLSRAPQPFPSLDEIVKADSFLGIIITTLSSAKTPALRREVCDTLQELASSSADLARVANLVSQLNAFEERRIDEPDFERRLGAFAELEHTDLQEMRAVGLQVLLSNFTFFMQDAEEASIRSNAAALLQRFSKEVVAKDDASPINRQMFASVVIPAIKRAQRSGAEAVRREGLQLLASVVKLTTHMQNLRELKPLLAEGDEEASFFYNVFHIQIHRRIRAFQRLASYADQGFFGNGAVVEYLLPIIEQTIAESDKNSAGHNLLSEAIRALGRVSARLRWGSYFGLLNKYLRQVKDRSSEERPMVRSVLSILEAFPFELRENATTADSTDSKGSASHQDKGALAQVKSSIIPTLLDHLDQDAKAEDHVRLPIAMGVVYIVRKLPAEDQSPIVVNLFRSLSNILKAKAQETRDIAREMVLKVQAALSPSYLPVLVREMHKTLTRGTQKATLAYVVHAILVQFESGASDTALQSNVVKEIAEVALEDLFGLVAEDRITAAGKHKAREMKQSKSLDTVELLGRCSSPRALRSIFETLEKALCTELREVHTTPEQVFKRLSVGLSANAHLDKSASLSLAHSLITQRFSTTELNDSEEKSVELPTVLRKRKEIETKDASRRILSGQHANNFTRLGLDFLAHNVRKGRYDFREADDLSKLDALVGPVGNTLHASESTTNASGLRLLAELAKAKLPSIRAGSGLLMKQIMSIIQRSGGLQGDLSLNALKALSALLRELPGTKLMDKDFALLMEWTFSEIEEPAVQSTLFAFLRVLLSSKVMSPALYDTMDNVAHIMITNQSAQVREACRSLFLQFLLDYPQGKGRLKNQLSFLASNLSYEFESGRLSVLELLRAIVAKFDKQALQIFSDALFVALVMVIANDDSQECRAKAIDLLQSLSRDADAETMRRNILLTKGWAGNVEKPGLVKVGMQVLRVAATTVQEAGHLPAALEDAPSIATNVIVSLAAAAQQNTQAAEASAEAISLWRSLQKTLDGDTSSLQAFSDSKIWIPTLAGMIGPTKHLCTAASSLLAEVLAKAGQQSSQTESAVAQPAVFAAKHIIEASKREDLDDALAKQLRHLLVDTARIIAASSASTSLAVESDEEEDEDDSDSGEEGEAKRASPLAWWFSRVSFTLRGLLTAWNRTGARKVSALPLSLCRVEHRD